jgi:hypothetical protein
MPRRLKPRARDARESDRRPRPPGTIASAAPALATGGTGLPRKEPSDAAKGAVRARLLSDEGATPATLARMLAPTQGAGLAAREARDVSFATCATGRLAGHPGVVCDLAADPLRRGRESGRCACRRPDPRRLASARRCRSPCRSSHRRRPPGCCYRDQRPWHVRRPSAPAFTDDQAQSEDPCNNGIVARAFRRRRRRRRGPAPSWRRDR